MTVPVAIRLGIKLARKFLSCVGIFSGWLPGYAGRLARWCGANPIEGPPNDITTLYFLDAENSPFWQYSAKLCDKTFVLFGCLAPSGILPRPILERSCSKLSSDACPGCSVWWCFVVDDDENWSATQYEYVTDFRLTYDGRGRTNGQKFVPLTVGCCCYCCALGKFFWFFKGIRTPRGES